MTARILPIVSLAAIAVTALAGAASAADSGKAPDPRIGEEVKSVCFAQTISGWRAIKGEDHAVLLEKGVNDWYRAELAGSCRESDFRSAITIGIESRPAGGCLTRGDAIIVKAPGDFMQRCIITRLAKWDDDAAPAQEDMKESDPQ